MRTRIVTAGAPKAQLAVAAAAMLIALALKQHYSDARADDLLWVLTPTAQLAGAMTGSPFTLQPGEGYLSRERLFLIEKSCAGVNFMIAAFGMLVFTLFHRARTAVSAGSVLAVSLIAGYMAAVVVNAVRIAMAMWLAAHPVALSISSAAVHRLEGILVYFCGLMLLYEAVQRLDRRAPHWSGR
jgi:exosortase K